ncbi:alpha/beta fold hydrolase [Hoeflea prorocentri]|uniref:Alpha/beta fold hydrolase n=1 Tax=Hoeflea prorocentri TaxID=1922333 RepID=A0A9X3UJW9_9HYPH|nr:alpha/beta fold hydrolase [Hoeflea prorocentri]MCY6380166.1 alpha/beta fold hydrolase [Hoeflea prorocentri]MDA5397966.1 alpha/beta fold hydrolase [Hoeflea prorocentri]
MPTVTINGDEMFYRHNGADERADGLAVVLVHGAGGSTADWPASWLDMQQADETRLSSVPVIAVDLPGHGKSAGASRQSVAGYAEAIAGFLDALNLQRVLLVGHSMGAAIALTLAADKNPRLAGISLLAGAAKLAVSPAILDGLQNQFEATVGNIVKYSWHREVDDDLKQAARERLLNCPQNVVYDDFLACSRYDLTDRLVDVAIPVLIVAAADDRMVPAETAVSLSEKLGTSKQTVLDNCGHYLQIEKAALTSDTLADFLANDLANGI